MIVLDTTVLVYAVGRDHPLAAPSRALLSAIGAGTVRATTTPEVIQEFTRVRSRRTDRSEAVAAARDYRTLLSPLLTVDGDDLDRGLTLFEDHEALGAFDSVLAAATRRHRATLVSADQAFDDVDDLEFIDLATPDLLDRL